MPVADYSEILQLIPVPHLRERRFPSEWPQTVWPEGLGGSELPPLDPRVVPASCP